MRIQPADLSTFVGLIDNGTYTQASLAVLAALIAGVVLLMLPAIWPIETDIWPMVALVSSALAPSAAAARRCSRAAGPARISWRRSPGR